jgi:hypothetical protein
MEFLKGLLRKPSHKTEAVKSRYSNLSRESFLVKLRTTTVSEPLRRELRLGGSSAEDDLFTSYLLDLKKPWMSISTQFSSSQSKPGSRGLAEETLRRLDFFEEVYEGLGKIGRSKVTYAKSFIQVLIFTINDLTQQLLDEHSTKVVKVLFLVQLVAVEDISPLLLCDEFSVIFSKFIKAVLECVIGCPADKLRDFQQLIFTAIQTNFALGELYAAHLQFRSEIDRLFLRILENYKEILSNSPMCATIFSMKAGSFVNSGLLRCSDLNLCLNLRELDISLEVVLQLSYLSNYTLDAVFKHCFKKLLFEYLVMLLLNQFNTLPDDETLRHVMMHKVSNLVKMFGKTVEVADVAQYSLTISIKELFYNTSAMYFRDMQSDACTSFTRDNTLIARFFRYLSSTFNKLVGLEELECNLVLMLQSLTVVEMLQGARDKAPVVHAYSLELVNRYLEVVISKGLGFEWLVNTGICEVLLNPSLFTLNTSQNELVQAAGTIAVSFIYEIICKIANVESAAAICLQSWHQSIASHFSDLDYITNSLTLLIHISSSPEGVDALSKHETFSCLLSVLNEYLFSPQTSSLNMECVDKLMQMLNLMLKLRDLEIKTELFPDFFGSLMRDPLYFSLACNYLTEAFKNPVLSPSIYDQFIQVLRDQTSSALVKEMLSSVEGVLQKCTQLEREDIQTKLIKRIPAAVIKKINDTKDLGLCTSLLSLIRSLFSASSRSSQMDVIELLFKSTKDIIRKRVSSDSEFKDLIFNLLLILFETTQLEGSSDTFEGLRTDSSKRKIHMNTKASMQTTEIEQSQHDDIREPKGWGEARTRNIRAFEVQNPKLIPFIISMLSVCDKDDIVEHYLCDLKGYISQSLHNLAVFSNFLTIDKLLKFITRPAAKQLSRTLTYDAAPDQALSGLGEEEEGRSSVKTQALELIELVGSYYIRPSSLKLILERLNASLLKGQLTHANELLELLLRMSYSPQDRFAISGECFANSRAVPRQFFHFKSEDAYLKVLESGSPFENDSCSFVMWVYFMRPGDLFSLYASMSHESLRSTETGEYPSRRNEADTSAIRTPTHTARPRLLATVNQNCQIVLRISTSTALSDEELPICLKIALEKWCLVGLTLYRNTVTVALDDNPPQTAELPSNIAAEFKAAKEISMSFGKTSDNSSASISPSFIGDLAQFFVVAGMRDLPFSEIYSLGLDLVIEPKYLETRNLSQFEEASSSRFKEMTDKITLKLLADSFTEVPKAVSLKANRLKNPDSAASSKSDRLAVKSFQVSVCCGHSLLEAFHALGGLKLLVGLLHKFGQVPGASKAVERVVKLLRNLIKTKHLMTYQEIVQMNLLEVLSRELRLLAKHHFISNKIMRNVFSLLRTPWLYRVPINIDTVSDSAAVEAMLAMHPSFLIVTDYMTWRSLDQPCLFSRLAEFSSIIQEMTDSPIGGPRSSVLHTLYVNYFLLLARDNTEVLGKMKQLPSFIRELRLKLNLLSVLQLIEYEVTETQSLEALQLLLEITGDFAVEDFQGLASKKLGLMLKTLSSAADFIVKKTSEDLEKRCDVMKCCADILTKMLNVKFRPTNPSVKLVERVGCDFKGFVFSNGQHLRKSEMLGLFYSFFKHCKDTGDIFDFKAMLSVLRKRCEVLEVTTNNELMILAEIIVEQFRLLQEYGEAYEAMHNFSCTYLQQGDILTNYEYLSKLLEHVMTFKPLNDLQLTFILYFAEDISRLVKVPLRLPLIEQLHELLVVANQAHNNDPKLPLIRSWDRLHEIEVECPTFFRRREGGFIRAFLGILLRNLVESTGDDLLRALKLLRRYLKLGPEQYRVTFTAIDAMGSLSSEGSFQAYLEEPNLFSSEVNLLGYVFGELADAIRLLPRLRVPAAFELMIECLLTKDKNLTNFVNCYETRQHQHFALYMQRCYSSLGAICCSGITSGREFWESYTDTEIDYEAFEREKAQLEVLRETLGNCRRERAYEMLLELMQSQQTALRKIIDYALAFASVKVGLVEASLETQLYFSLDNFSQIEAVRLLSKRRETPSDCPVIRDLKNADNRRQLGKVKLKSLLKALQQPCEILQKPHRTVEFWKLSQISDAQGRRQRLVPYHGGSNYLDKVHKKYLRDPEVSPNIDIDIDSIISSIGQGSFTEGNSELDGTYMAVDWQVIGQVERAKGSSDKRAVLECERISVSSAVYGILEVSTSLIIFRSWNHSRPTGSRYEVSTQSYCHKQCKSLKVWKLSEVEEIFPKTFMHVLCALEIYCKDGRSYLFNLFQSEALIGLRDMLASCPEFDKVYVNNGREEILLWTRLWKKRKISNLEYLMRLNRYSSRSFNNLNQYPVFPWVLANYTKDRPCFTDEDYRDLTKPIGALHPVKKEEAEVRYRNFEDEIGLGPPYHYGSHFSSGPYVLYYLLRLEPYSAQAIVFQDNHFDVADRLFFSLETAWECSYSGSGDFKELVPELFFLPEAMINLHNYNLGRRQTGDLVDHVQLPNWACAGQKSSKMDPYRFIFFHRKALESGKVSEKLPKWINLIFGSKQEDKAEVNVFSPYTYMHHFTQLLASADVPRASLLAQVAHFGQTPAKLFEKNHDDRKLDGPEIKDRHLFMEFDASSIIETRAAYPQQDPKHSKPRPTSDRTVSKAKTSRLALTPVVVSVHLKRELSCLIYHLEGRYFTHFFDVNKPDSFKLLESYTARDTCELDLAKVNLSLEAVNSEWFGFSGRVLVSGRHPDNSFRLSLVMTKPCRVVPRLQVSHHNDVVSCLHLADDVLLVTGALDGSLAVWEVDLNNPDLACKLRLTLRGHSSAITQVVVSVPLQLVASLSTVSAR